MSLNEGETVQELLARRSSYSLGDSPSGTPTFNITSKAAYNASLPAHTLRSKVQRLVGGQEAVEMERSAALCTSDSEAHAYWLLWLNLERTIIDVEKKRQIVAENVSSGKLEFSNVDRDLHGEVTLEESINSDFEEVRARGLSATDRASAMKDRSGSLDQELTELGQDVQKYEQVRESYVIGTKMLLTKANVV